MENETPVEPPKAPKSMTSAELFEAIKKIPCQCKLCNGPSLDGCPEVPYLWKLTSDIPLVLECMSCFHSNHHDTWNSWVNVDSVLTSGDMSKIITQGTEDPAFGLMAKHYMMTSIMYTPKMLDSLIGGGGSTGVKLPPKLKKPAAPSPNLMGEPKDPQAQRNLYTCNKELIRSQKARGIQVLYSIGRDYFPYTSMPGTLLLPARARDVWAKHGLDLDRYPFARGCPSRPRHGFEDSIKVASLDELDALYERVLKLDDKGEVILMPFIEASHSCIFVPESGALLIGPGHDGATAGKASITIPVAPVSKEDLAPLREAATISEENHTYVEMVHGVIKGPYDLASMKMGGGQTYRVQARSGEPIPLGKTEYIPKTVKITKVLVPPVNENGDEDMIGWEAIVLEHSHDGVKADGKPGRVANEGVVAWAPVGHQLGSHASNHAMACGMPFLTRKEEPKVGQIIHPPETKVWPFDKSEFFKGILASEKYHGDQEKELLLASIAILHNLGAMDGSREQSRLLGLMTGGLFRVAAIACLGEARHYRNPLTGDKPYSESRGAVYSKWRRKTFKGMLTALLRATPRFVHDGAWSGGFGGFPWMGAGVSAIALYNRASEGNREEVLKEANILVNLAHNGGWLFNKFASTEDMDTIKEHPGAALAHWSWLIYEVMTFNPNAQEMAKAKIKQRNSRMSKNWELDKPIVKPGNFGKQDTVQLRVDGVLWRPAVWEEGSMDRTVIERAMAEL